MDITQIDTRIGTKSKYEFSRGNTLPLTGMPFAMNYLSVQTNHDHSWWFDPDEHTFAGLRLTHQPSPWIGDFQHLLFKLKTRNITNNQELDDYDPQTSIFRPDLLVINNISQQIKIMTTVCKFGGAIKAYNYTDQPLSLIIQAEKLSALKKQVDGSYTFKINNFSACEDPNFSMWVAIKAKSLTYQQTNSEDEQSDLIFNLASEDELLFASSFISAEQAQYNLSLLHSFDQIQQQAVAAWQKIFNKIQIADHHPALVKKFYENLYRSFLYPMQFYETDAKGNELHYSTTLKKVMTGKMYTNIGFWDVYRTSFPLYSLICPQKYAEFLASFYQSYLETGYLPRWLSPDERGMMPGTMLDVIIADAAVKGIALDKVPLYLKAMIKGAETSSKDSKYGREGLEEYKNLGYVSANYPESVNKTLDYAYSDWAISVIAKIVGQTETAAHYAQRSLNYRNLFNPQTGLMMPKDDQGNWVTDFDNLDWGKGFTEGSAWQNSFNVYQDIPGLIKLYGGTNEFIQKLTELVNQAPIYNVGSYGQVIHEMREMSAQPLGQLAISNQPSFHLPYLFALAGKPHYTELLVKQIMKSFGINDYPGDEDNGSMSSWYVWSSLGLYPEAAGKGSYVFGIPAFDQVELNLEDNKKLTFITQDNDFSKQFVASRKFNDEKCGNTITHAQLVKGGSLKVKLSVLPE